MDYGLMVTNSRGPKSDTLMVKNYCEQTMNNYWSICSTITFPVLDVLYTSCNSTEIMRYFKIMSNLSSNCFCYIEKLKVLVQDYPPDRLSGIHTLFIML